jgi:hypothetical protein
LCRWDHSPELAEGVADQQHPEIPEQWRLMIRPSSPILFRVQPQCAYQAHEWDETSRAYQLARTQTEMQAFTAFLKHLLLH